MSKSIVCISDTHLKLPHSTVPAGDILIHAGDGTSRGTIDEVKQLAKWFQQLKAQFSHMIFVPGNHDFAFENCKEESVSILDGAGVKVLVYEFIEVDGLRIFGSPWTPWFHDWAFNMRKGDDDFAKSLWNDIPDNSDIVVTHGPAYGILDNVARGVHVGCPHLRDRLEVIKPKLHICGHIHESRGKKIVHGTTFVNASVLDLRYSPYNEKHFVFKI